MAKDINGAYFEKRTSRKSKKRIMHCVDCQKKRNLLFYTSTNNYILQICNKCLDAISETKEGGDNNGK